MRERECYECGEPLGSASFTRKGKEICPKCAFPTPAPRQEAGTTMKVEGAGAAGTPPETTAPAVNTALCGTTRGG